MEGRDVGKKVEKEVKNPPPPLKKSGKERKEAREGREEGWEGRVLYRRGDGSEVGRNRWEGKWATCKLVKLVDELSEKEGKEVWKKGRKEGREGRGKGGGSGAS